MFAEKVNVSITTDASGDGIGTLPVKRGRVASLHYVKADFADTVDFTITVEGTGEVLWSEENVTASKAFYPRAVTNETAAGGEYVGGSQVSEPILVVNDNIKIVIANGGDTKTGDFIAVVG